MAQIHEAIPKIMKAIGPIAKGRTNTQQNYKFRGIDDVYNAAQGPMLENGVFPCPVCYDVKREERQGRSGGVLIYTTLMMKTTFYAPDGSNIVVETIGEGMDSGDKSSNKAMSAAMKYAYFMLFAIPLGEKEPEDDNPDPAAKPNARPQDTRACPKCGKTNSVIVGKGEFGGGLVCFKKKEGCGHAWETTEHPFNENHKGKKEPTNGHAEKPKGEVEKTPLVRLNEALKAIGCATDEDREQVIVWCSGGACEKLDDAFHSDERAAQVLEFLNAKRTAGVKTTAMLATAKQYAEDTAKL